MAVVFALIWLATAALTRFSSLAAIVAAIATPIAIAAYGRPDLALPIIPLAGLLVWKHRENIARLLAKTEPRIGQKRDAPTPDGDADTAN